MPKRVHNSNRVLIVGGGVAGLAAAAALARAGRPVTVLERSSLGSGASTRNHGRLHSGGLFAVDRPGIARLCYDSLRETLRRCPECVEPGSVGTAFLLPEPGAAGGDPDRWLRAWTAVGIPHPPLPTTQFLERVPGLAPEAAARVFLLPDRSIRTDVLLRRLAADAAAAGAEVRPETEVARLLRVRDEVRGAVTALGEEITARLVVLAANVGNVGLLPELGRAGGDGRCRLVPLKSHLIAVEPGVADRPFCLPEEDGLGHLPHPPRSVFGTERWLPADGPDDGRPVPEELDRLRGRLARLFPGRAPREVAAWAGTTVQALPPGRDLTASVAWPAVIDHAREPAAVRGVVSVFPGRETLWPALADETARVVAAALGDAPAEVAAPPWLEDADAAVGADARRETVDLYHCQKCGRVRRHAPGLRPPVCCEVEMAKAAETHAAPAGRPE